MDLTFFLPVGTVFVVMSLVRWWWWGRPLNAASSAHAFARKVDLALAGRTEEIVTARLVRRERAAVVGSVLGGLAATALAALATEGPAGGFGMLVAMLGLIVGHALGYGVVAWRESVSRPAAGPRLARATVPTHGDYVAAHERVGAWVVAGLSLVSGATLLALDRSAALDGVLRGTVPTALAAAAMSVPVLTVVLDEILARRLLDRPQVASASLELAWDDALRARTLRDMVGVPLTSGFFGLLGPIGVVGQRVEGGWPGTPAAGVLSGVYFLILLGGVVMAVVSLVRRPEGHVRRRLWPTPPGQAAAPPTPLPTWGVVR